MRQRRDNDKQEADNEGDTFRPQTASIGNGKSIAAAGYCQALCRPAEKKCASRATPENAISPIGMICTLIKTAKHQRR